MSRNEKLFRAIVVMGVSMTSGACFDPSPECTRCVPPDARTDGRIPDTVAVADAGVDSPPSPSDAPVDVVIIL